MTGSLSPHIIGNFKQAFEDKCLELVVAAYQEIVNSAVSCCSLEEEDITEILSGYMNTNPQRLSWNIVVNTEDRLDGKATMPKKGFAKKLARIDVRFTSITKKEEFKYYLEAKNLKEKDSQLKRRYIRTGIDNYISGKYKNGFLVGYILEGVVLKTVDGINALLIKDKRATEIISLSTKKIATSEVYISTHTAKDLTHLFFDLTS